MRPTTENVRDLVLLLHFTRMRLEPLVQAENREVSWNVVTFLMPLMQGIFSNMLRSLVVKPLPPTPAITKTMNLVMDLRTQFQTKSTRIGRVRQVSMTEM